MRKLTVLVFMLMFFLLLPIKAEAAYHPSYQHSSPLAWAYHFQGNELMAVQLDNGAIVGNQSQLRDLLQYQSGFGWGYPGADGYLYQADPCGGQPTGRRFRIGTVTGVVAGASIGGWKGWKGTLIGAGIGGAGAYVADRIIEHRERSHAVANEMNCRERETRTTIQKPPIQTPESYIVQGGPFQKSSDGPYFKRGRGEFELINNSSAYAEVLDGERFLFRMRPKEIRRVGPPEEEYKAYALLPNDRGGLSEGGLETHSTNRGWTFEEPAVARR